MEIRKKIKQRNKLNKKDIFSVLFSLLIISIALPLWVGAYLVRKPDIDLFRADGAKGFQANQPILFTIKASNDNNQSLNTLLSYGDGENYSFQMMPGVTYLKRHFYRDSGSYKATLLIRKASGEQRQFKLLLRIENKKVPQIRSLSFDNQSSKTLGERVYLAYEISCNDFSQNDFNVIFDWGDNNQEIQKGLCGKGIISHRYLKAGIYLIKLSVRNINNRILASQSLEAIVQRVGRATLQADFFIRTARPRAGELIYFQDRSTDKLGRKNIKSWQWDFGDGTQAQDINPFHIYNKSKRYKVALTVTNKNGDQSTFYRWITVLPGYEGKLVKAKGDNKIYQIIKGKKHWIPTPAILSDYHFNDYPVFEIDAKILASYPRVKLVRVGASPDIYYLTQSWMKRKIPNMDIFYSYNDKLEDIVSISQKELDWYPENHLIKYDGDWQVYYLENGIKHWIKSAQIFNQHGFSWLRIAPVNWQEFDVYPIGAPID